MPADPAAHGPGNGRAISVAVQEQAMVNHWYFFRFDAHFGPFYIKVYSYFPSPGRST